MSCAFQEAPCFTLWTKASAWKGKIKQGEGTCPRGQTWGPGLAEQGHSGWGRACYGTLTDMLSTRAGRALPSWEFPFPLKLQTEGGGSTLCKPVGVFGHREVSPRLALVLRGDLCRCQDISDRVRLLSAVCPQAQKGGSSTHRC